MGLPFKSHNRTVLSLLPLAIIFPSGLKATGRTAFPCPLKGLPIGLPFKSHNLTVLSLLPLAIIVPSGLKATDTNPPLCALKG